MKIKRWMIFAGVALVVLGGGGFGAWRVLRTRAAAAPAPPKHEEVKATIGLTPLVVNVAGDSRRYVRLAITLGVTDVHAVKVVEEAKPRLLDLIIDVAAGTDAAALTAEEGRARLKAKLRERIHAELHLPAVSEVYLTEFVVQ